MKSISANNMIGFSKGIHCKDLQVVTGTYRHVLLTGIENPCCKFYPLDKSFDKQFQLLLEHVSLTGKFENLLN